MFIDDTEILTMIKNPQMQEKGFRLFMQKYQEKIYWLIRRIVMTHEDTDDVIQNTFIKAFRNINAFEERSSLYTWLYKIATNEALSFKRSKHGKHTVSADQMAHKLEEKSTSDFDGEAATAKLNMALSELPEKQRTVFNLRYYDEMSYQEMSELLQTSVGALKASYHHAVKKIEMALTV